MQNYCLVTLSYRLMTTVQLPRCRVLTTAPLPCFDETRIVKKMLGPNEIGEVIRTPKLGSAIQKIGNMMMREENSKGHFE